MGNGGKSQSRHTSCGPAIIMFHFVSSMTECTLWHLKQQKEKKKKGRWWFIIVFSSKFQFTFQF